MIPIALNDHTMFCSYKHLISTLRNPCPYCGGVYEWKDGKAQYRKYMREEKENGQ